MSSSPLTKALSSINWLVTNRRASIAEVEMVIDSLRQSPVKHQWVAVLKDKLAERYLPIYIGSSQAETLKRELTDVSLTRPTGNDPISRDIKRIGSKVRSVKIDELEDNEFSAKLVLATPSKPYEVDCPVAKAPAIAVRAKVPIFADEAVLNKIGISIGA